MATFEEWYGNKNSWEW